MKKKHNFLRLLLMTFVLVAMSVTTIFADEVNEEVKDARNGVLQINIEYQDEEGNRAVLGGGTGFLINEDTIVTAYHVAHMIEDTEVYDSAVEYFGADFDKDKVQLKVVVKDDVSRTATIIQESEKYDFSILELEKAIGGREVLKLSTDDSLSETQQVYALGFPDAVSQFQNENSYTSEDVTIEDGRVTKSNESDGVKYVQHSASLSAGYSGGPLVDENGVVVAINRGTVSDYNYSVAISQLIEILDTDHIDYTGEDGPVGGDVEDDTTEEDTTVEDDTTEEDTTPVSADVEDDDEKPTVNEDDEDEEGEEGMNKILIIAIIAVVVVVLIIIIILIATLGKGKKQDTRPVNGGMPPYTPPYNNAGGNRPQPPYNGGGMTPPPVPPTPYSNEGGDATTVLSEGGDATTVLGVSAAGAMSITRVKTGEKIAIVKPEFLIGKERRRVDYCISDNNSVSRVHVKLVNRGGQLYLIDMGATNGTFVNGTKLSMNQEVRISAGDRFKLADEEFQV